MKLYNIFEELILESARISKLLTEAIDFNQVKDAIDNKYNVNISYQDEDGVQTNRYIQPYVLGDTRANNKAIRAYQIFGQSRTLKTKGEGAHGGWRIFRLDRILDWKPTNIRFNMPVSDRPNFMISAGRFNPNGDKMFKRIDAIARFNTEAAPMKQEPIQPSVQPKAKPQGLQPKTSGPAKSANIAKGDPRPKIKPEEPIDTSKTTQAKPTVQPINKNKKIENGNTTTSRPK